MTGPTRPADRIDSFLQLVMSLQRPVMSPPRPSLRPPSGDSCAVTTAIKGDNHRAASRVSAPPGSDVRQGGLSAEVVQGDRIVTALLGGSRWCGQPGLR